MLTISPDNLVAGETATVTISGSSRGGQTVTVKIDNGEGDTVDVDVELDENGEGSATWTVAEWALANFNYSTCDEISRDIDEPAATVGGNPSNCGQNNN